MQGAVETNNMRHGIATVVATTVTVLVAQIPTADTLLKYGQVFAVWAGGTLSISMILYYVIRIIREGRQATVELAKIAEKNAEAIKVQAETKP